jgi:hypothetical protein
MVSITEEYASSYGPATLAFLAQMAVGWAIDLATRSSYNQLLRQETPGRFSFGLVSSAPVDFAHAYPMKVSLLMTCICNLVRTFVVSRFIDLFLAHSL